jgi:hypothetical protein
LHAAARPLAVVAGCYEITPANLRLALNDPLVLSLDVIKARDAVVYAHVVSRPQTLLNAIEGDLDTVWTIDDPTAFAAILEDLSGLDVTLAEVVIAGARPTCIVDDLSSVPERHWPALAAHRRFAATLANVDSYLREFHEVDAALGRLLVDAGTIKVPDRPPTLSEGGDAAESDASALDDAKFRVATAVLDARTAVPDPATRANLVRSLNRDIPLAADIIPMEEGALFASLLQSGLVEDGPDIFRHFAPMGWPTLKLALLQPSRFAEFATPEILGSESARKLLEDR